MFVFLMLMLLAVQVLYGLFTTSTVTAATYDAARLAAGSEGVRSQEAVEARVRELLGPYAESGNVVVTYGTEGGQVVVTVAARRLSFLPVPLRRPLGLDVVRRTARVRIEDPVGVGR